MVQNVKRVLPLAHASRSVTLHIATVVPALAGVTAANATIFAQQKSGRNVLRTRSPALATRSATPTTAELALGKEARVVPSARTSGQVERPRFARLKVQNVKRILPLVHASRSVTLHTATVVPASAGVIAANATIFAQQKSGRNVLRTRFPALATRSVTPTTAELALDKEARVVPSARTSVQVGRPRFARLKVQNVKRVLPLAHASRSVTLHTATVVPALVGVIAA